MNSTNAPRLLAGCDLQPVDVVADAIRAFGDRYLDRVYTSEEQASYASGGAASLAARFAAKEAVLKLIGEPDGIDLRSIEVRRGAHGRPSVHLSGRAAEVARARDVGEIDLSLSHTPELAMAVAVALGSTTTHLPTPAEAST